MSMQQKRWGHDFTRNREGNIQTHKAVNYPFCLLCPIIYFFQKLVEVVNALGWEEYGFKFVLGKPSIFGKMNFDLWGK